MNHQILTSISNQVIINKKTFSWILLIQRSMRLKKKIKKRYEYLDLAREVLKSLWNMKESMIPNVVCILGSVLEDQEKRLGELEMKNWNHLPYGTARTGSDT